MARRKERTLLWWAMLILGLIGTALLLHQRIGAQRMPEASAALSQRDLTLLARAGGMTEDEWWEKVSPAGLRFVIQDGWVRERDGDGLYVIPDESGRLPASIERKGDSALWDAESGRTVIPVVIEDHTRTSMHLPALLNPGDGPLTVIRALWLFPDYADRAVGSDTREIENLLFRAATDRSVSLFLLAPFYNEKGEMLSDPEIYAGCLSSLGERLERRGVHLGANIAPLGSLDGRQDYQTILAALLPCAAGVWLVMWFLPKRALSEKKRKWLEIALIVLSALAVSVLVLKLPALAEKLLPLASAVLLPCVGVTAVCRWAKGEPELLAALPLPVSALAALALVLGWSLLCGLSVSGLMTAPGYLMGVTVFSGVKFALGLPLLLCFVLLAASLRRALLRTGKKLWLWLTLAALAGMALLLVVRSGDLPGGISHLETGFRNLLEDFFYGRPRTKELLFAVPCVPVFVWACRRKFAPLQLLCGMGIGLELVSVTNTFCHGVASVSFSVIRSAEGAAAGWCLGMTAVGILCLLVRKSRT